MKEERRKVYNELAKEANGSLCTFCQKAEWNSEGCCEGYAVCLDDTGISYQSVNEEDLPPGCDCPVFEAGISVTLASDIVGAIISQGFEL